MASFRERYPPPWRIERTPSGYRVVASNDMSLLYIYAEEGWALTNSNRLSFPEARALATAIAKLPDSFEKPGG